MEDKELRLKKARLFLNKHFTKSWGLKWHNLDNEVKILAKILKPTNLVSECSNCGSKKIIQEPVQSGDHKTKSITIQFIDRTQWDENHGVIPLPKPE